MIAIPEGLSWSIGSVRITREGLEIELVAMAPNADLTQLFVTGEVETVRVTALVNRWRTTEKVPDKPPEAKPGPIPGKW